MKRLAAVMRRILLPAAVIMFTCHARAADLAADTLTVTVGYFGGPYYEKAVFTVDELWSMDVVYADYTAIDNMPSVVIDHVAGVRLSDIVEASGIDLGSVQSFNFWTNDKEGGYYNSMTKASLIDTRRYCYYSLPDNFDYDMGEGNEYAVSDGVPVPTVIALADDWRRALAGASFGSDYMDLNAATRFRLVYGQTDAVTRTASESAKWIHSIEVTLGGAPTLTADVSALELEVGSAFRSEVRVRAADAVIAESAEIEWSSRDESIATVDGGGTITAHEEGATVITARFAGQSVHISVNASAEGGQALGESGGPDVSEEAGDTGGGGGAEEPSGGYVAGEPPPAAVVSPVPEPEAPAPPPAAAPERVPPPAAGAQGGAPAVIGIEL
ncbi:MAG: Ig-like domain-containing protein, partial [Oscillospiraceae bacterium]|nr:Ig-like domain-containing protein [Oscillospiraceae bacterium]